MKVDISYFLTLAGLLNTIIAAPVVVTRATELNFADLEASNEVLPLNRRQYSEDTYNQLIDGTPCRDITVIYARGTTQPGNVGNSTAIGPVFFNNLASQLGGIGRLAIQGVTYAADLVGFLEGGDPAGSKTMANLVSTAGSKCPSTKIVVTGYSQGAQLAHNAAQMITAASAAKVAAVVVFGDPKRGQSFGAIPASKTLTICHSGDNICDGGIIVTDQHGNYQRDAPRAAAFVASKV